MRLFKRLIVVALLAVLFATIAYFYREKQKEEALVYQQVEKYNAFIKEARQEREQLQKESKKIYEQLYLPDMGSTVILLSDTRIEQKEDAIAIMDFYDYHGVIALSASYMPEDNIEDYLTRQDVDELIEKGYEVVIKIINEDISRTYKKFVENGYDVKGFYFEGNNVGQSKIDDVKRIDPNLIIIGTYEDGYNYVDDLLITAYGSAQSGVKTKYEDSTKISKPVALTVGYDNSKSQYSEGNFEAMIKTVKVHNNDGSSKVCNISEAIQVHDEYLLALNEEFPEETQRLNEINLRIEEINNEINNIGE